MRAARAKRAAHNSLTPVSRLVIAVDAMGGDDAPSAVVAGAVSASRRFSLAIALVGRQAEIEALLARHQLAGSDHDAISIVDAPDVIGNDESPLAAIRRKPRASIRVAAELVASGEASALFSAGHTGATVMAAHAAFGVLAGVDRPALGVTVPTHAGASLLLDVGANVECRAEHLVQFACMGSAYARIALRAEHPRVGLLSIGEEAGKGNDLIRDAHARLRGMDLNFIGNVEARDLFSGRADVVVCDGFTGNVALKVGEGLIDAIELMLREELGSSLVSQIGGRLIARQAFARLKQRVDYAEYGAAPLLGMKKLTLVGHGRSSARAVESGIATAARLAEAGVVEQLGDAIRG